MGCLVKLKRVSLCGDVSRQTTWELNMHRPVDREQFHIVEQMIHSLRVINNNFIVIAFTPAIQNASYIQITLNNKNDYYIELHFEIPCVFSYRFEGKKGMRKHPWTQYAFHAKTANEASQIFKEVLCYGCLPNLSNWKNCTSKTYKEGLKQKRIIKI